jgi:hypothetical protein
MNSTAANDKKILDLKTIIATKKSKIKSFKFIPVTNCSLELDGTRFNIHTLSANDLTFLLVKLNSLVLSMNDLKDHRSGSSTDNGCFIINSLTLSGYSLQNWIADIKLKLEIIAQKEEENNLKALEAKLSVLLSNDKRTELELDAIEKLL